MRECHDPPECVLESDPHQEQGRERALFSPAPRQMGDTVRLC